MSNKKSVWSMTEEELNQELTGLPNGEITHRSASYEMDVLYELAQLGGRDRPQNQVFYAKVGLTPLGNNSPVVEVIRLYDNRYLTIHDGPVSSYYAIRDDVEFMIDEAIDAMYADIKGDDRAEERFDVQITNNKIGYTVDDFYPVNN